MDTKLMFLAIIIMVKMLMLCEEPYMATNTSQPFESIANYEATTTLEAKLRV
jgi:hypothetical protein